MDIMDQVRALPQELKDNIFLHLLLPSTSPSRSLTWVKDWQPVSYTMPIPRAKPVLSELTSLMNELLKNSRETGPFLEWEQATLCVVRIFQYYNLFRLIPDGWFVPHLVGDSGVWHGQHFKMPDNTMLEASGLLRLNMLARECSKARGMLNEAAAGIT